MLNRIAVGAALATALLWPGVSQAQTEGEDATLIVTKVVEGEVPPGTTFDVEINCNTTVPEGGPTVQTITFDETGGSQTLNVPQFAAECSVVEVETGGAGSITYAGAQIEPICQVTTTADGAVVNYKGSSGTCEVTITNTFPESEPEPPPAVDPADVVDAQPAFTG